MDSPPGSALARLLPVLVAACAALLAWAAPAAAVPPAGAELPDLISDPPGSPHLETSVIGGQPKLLMRFDGFVHNDGDGPLEIHADTLSGFNLMDRTQVIRVPGAADHPETLAGEVIFEDTDGHDHYHLQSAAEYALFDRNGTTKLKEAAKVGFCLLDSQRRSGDADSHFNGFVTGFCAQDEWPTFSGPLVMGVTEGWRDIYSSSLPFQYVDVSATAPGIYRVGSEVDPDDYVLESDETNTVGLSGEVTVPGYLAKGITPATIDPGRTTNITLKADKFGSPGARQFKIVDPPEHGTLSVAAGQWFAAPNVKYTPDAGYDGPDPFTYVARDQGSQFPSDPPAATALVAVGSVPAAGMVGISGAPGQVFTGTAVQLAAQVTGTPGGVTWSVDGDNGGSAEAGTISSSGLYSAPASVPPGGSVSIRARAASGAYDEVDLAIVPAPPPQPAPTGPVETAPAGVVTPLTPAPTRRLARLSRARMFRTSGRLYVRLTPGRSGRLIVRAKIRRKRFRVCSVRVQAGRALTCRVKVPRALRRHRVAITARLVSGRRTLAVRRASARGTRSSAARLGPPDSHAAHGHGDSG